MSDLDLIGRWTHSDGCTEHVPDPHYNGNGRPGFWTCHVKDCGVKLKLDGRPVPITVTAARVSASEDEPAMSAQP